MKHYFLTVVLALLAMAGGAQTLGRTGLQKRGVAKGRTELCERRAVRVKAEAGAMPLMSRSAEDQKLITKQPAGKLYSNMSKSFRCYDDAGGFLYDQELTDVVTDIVVAADGIYVRDPLSLGMFDFDSHYWVKATKAGGDTLVVKPQPVFEYKYTNEFGRPVTEMLYTSRMKLSFGYDPDYGDEVASLNVVKNNPEVRFVWRNDSLIMVDMAENELYGLVFSDGYWGGVAECNTVITKLAGQPVALPEGLKAEQWQMRYYDEAEVENGVLVNVAFDDDAVYIGNLPEALEGSWTKGVKEGDKVTFASGQYLGVDPDLESHTFFYGGYMEETWDSYWEEYVDSLRFTDAVTFVYDEAGKTLKSEENMVVNLGNTAPSLLSMMKRPELRPFTASDKPATPLDPVFTEYSPWTPEWPIGIATFIVSRFDADGNYLDPGKMYYNVYLDEELMFFYPDEYPLLEEETADMPCTYEDLLNVFVNGGSYTLNFYTSGYEKFGVQLFYTNGGETRSSNIVYYEPKNDSGIGGVAGDGGLDGAAGATYTDLFGRRVSQPASGVYIKSVRQADGSVKSAKVLIK